MTVKLDGQKDKFLDKKWIGLLIDGYVNVLQNNFTIDGFMDRQIDGLMDR